MIYSGIDWVGDIPTNWQMIPNKFLFYFDGRKVGENVNDFQLLSLELFKNLISNKK